MHKTDFCILILKLNSFFKVIYNSTPDIDLVPVHKDLLVRIRILKALTVLAACWALGYILFLSTQ